jgi:hypothetical protein
MEAANKNTLELITGRKKEKAGGVKELIACQQLSATQLSCDSFNLFHSFSTKKPFNFVSLSLTHSDLIYINIDVII